MTIVVDPKIFRDYDIRAVIPDQLNKEGIVRIAEGIVEIFKPRSIQIGHDMRITSDEFYDAVINRFIELGVDVVKLGLVSTDMLYFASGHFNEEFGLTVSASHNPPEFNGMKMVKKGAIAVSGNSGIYEIRDFVMSDKQASPIKNSKGDLADRDIMQDWIEHLLSFIHPEKMKPFKIVVDTGNGMAGHFMPHLEKKMPWDVTRMFYELDGTFPNHVPSPIEEKNRVDCTKKVLDIKADMGLVFDGDGDRVYMIDEKGRTVSGTVMTAIIAENLLRKNKGETILYNAIVGRIVPEIIKKHNGKGVRVRVGHTLIKEAMRKYNAIFCGEHSGHFYFRDNFFADSAILAALLVMELMSLNDKKLSDYIDEYETYPISGEINFEVEDKQETMKEIEVEYKEKANSTDWLDGVSVWFDDFWFNVRPSNTESLLRLNVEADNKNLLDQKTAELVELIKSKGGKLVE